MSAYYTANILFTVGAMTIMFIATGFNPALNEERRRVLRLLFVAIIVASLCEWSGNMLNGASTKWIWLHKLVKMTELSCAPFLGLMCGRSLSVNRTWEKRLNILLAVHAVLEIQSAFTGLIWDVDGQNWYHHGSLYAIYITAYTIGILYFLVKGLHAFRRYQQNGGVLLLLVTVFLIAGIGLSMLDDRVEVTWITVGMAAMILYKVYSDILLQVDGLTELGNRWGYEERLKRTHGQGIVLYFDVDNFKQTNDTYGHVVGDQCLCIVAQALRAAYGSSGWLYRIGGDEFCVLLERNLNYLEEMNEVLHERLEEARRKNPFVPGVSVGYARYDTSEEEIGAAVERADAEMYHAKNNRKMGQYV